MTFGASAGESNRGVTVLKPAIISIRVRALLIDMDGVLVSSTAADERCWLRWAQFHGVEGTFSLRATHGRRGIDTLRVLRPDLDPSRELKRLEEFDAEERSGTVALPGAHALLAMLSPQDWVLVTSATPGLMQQRLVCAGIEAPPTVISADRVSHGKPHPEPYTTGAALLGVAPAECLVIEDAPSGVAAGKAAGCSVLAVLSSHTAEELHGADWIVPTLESVTATRRQNDMIEVRFSLPRSNKTKD